MSLKNLENIFKNRETEYPEWKHNISENITGDSVSDNLFNHTFGTNYTHEDIIEITPIQNEQSPSPLMAIVGIGDTGDTIVNGHSRGKIRVNYQGGLLQSSFDISNNENYNYSTDIMEMEKPDLTLKNLGDGKYKIDSLYDQTHGANTPTREAFGQPNRISSDLLLHKPEGIGSTANLNIRAHQGYGGRGDEPYIVHPIGFSSPNARKLGYDRDGFPLRSAAEDFSRLVQYYLSSDGIQFMLKENVTNVAVGDGITLAEPFRFLKLPPLPIPMTGFLNVYQQKFQSQFPSLELYKTEMKEGVRTKTDTIFKFDGINGSLRKPGRKHYSELVNGAAPGLVMVNQGDLDPIIELNNPLDKLLVEQKKFKDAEFKPVRKSDNLTPGEFAKNAATNTVTAVNIAARRTFFRLTNALVNTAKNQLGEFTKLPFTQRPSRNFVNLEPGRKGLGALKDPIARSQVLRPREDAVDPSSGKTFPPLETELNDGDAASFGDFYLRIKDLRNNDFIYFRGFITGITENVTPSWNPVTYIGRSEDVWNYQKAERDLSFNLRIAPANNTEFTATYHKINKMTSLMYPAYTSDLGAMRMKPPFTELYMGHIGDHSKGQFGYLKSLTYTVNEQGDWDVVTSRPRVFDVAIGYQCLEKEAPSITTNFYRTSGV